MGARPQDESPPPEPPDEWEDPGNELEEGDYAPWRDPGKPEHRGLPDEDTRKKDS